MVDRLAQWLDALGYDAADPALHRAGDGVRADHPYAAELVGLLQPGGSIRADAVFDIEGVPTVLFVEDDGQPTSLSSGSATAPSRLDAIRQRIWNQNLISVVLVIQDERIIPMSVQRKVAPGPALQLAKASPYSEFSAADIKSNEIQQRLSNWFKPEERVDEELLKNLGAAVTLLDGQRVPKEIAQVLLGQILFISYLEHRGIVTDTYRQRRTVAPLHELIREKGAAGINRLIKRLYSDFNGDFLAPDSDAGDIWAELSKKSFSILDQFLSRVNLETGQGDFWNYDFSFIPVELISGIYETFLGEEKTKLSAYYTPRHLANLVIDQAFSGSKDVLQETIYDGACGSGILLTTAFRRMIGVAEARTGSQLSLRQRMDLLQRHIFGSDISETACRVTAFSLYLSLLERLEPSDILELQQNERVKLPPLRNDNLIGGKKRGDFFRKENPFAGAKKFSLLISNPPWKEPGGDEETTADKLAEETGTPQARRQIAGTYAKHAVKSVADNGRICLILPTSQLLAPTSATFLRDWLLHTHIIRLINFGDLQEMMFKSASHSCAVVLASPRQRGETVTIPPEETFDYWVPKADLSLVLGRLTLHSGDRHRIQTQAVYADSSRLVTLMWGNEADIALCSRLRLHGTISDLTNGPNRRWRHRKGVHREDKSAKPVSVEPLRDIPHITVEALKGELPVLHASLLKKWPQEIDQVVGLSEGLMTVFDGPRILFPDGFDNEREIRATFYDGPGSFTSSVGVLAGETRDDDLLRFVAVYLRSTLAKYFLVMRAFQVLCERNRVSLRNIKEFPFIIPARHPKPERATKIIEQIARRTRQLADAPLLFRGDQYESRKAEFDKLIFEYFDLTSREQILVDEAVKEFLPAIRPRGYARLFTPPQQRADTAQITRYAERLLSELALWRDRLQGNGKLRVEVLTMSRNHAGPLGIVHIQTDAGRNQRDASTVRRDTDAVNALLLHLQKERLLPMPLSGGIEFSPDTIVWTGRSLHLVRPLIRRFWLERVAMKDARKIVESLQQPSQPPHQQVA